MMIVWRISEKVIKTVLSCIVYNSYAHTYELIVGLGFGFI